MVLLKRYQIPTSFKVFYQSLKSQYHLTTSIITVTLKQTDFKCSYVIRSILREKAGLVHAYQLLLWYVML